MSKYILLASTFCILFIAKPSRSDVSSTSTTTRSSALPEPTSNTPSTPTVGSDTAVHDPLTPYDEGPADQAWSYEALTPAEQAVIDRGTDATGWAATHNAYASAVTDGSLRARGDAAAHQLGIENAAGVGVVP